jgi:serine/threonine-protein kinase
MSRKTAARAPQRIGKYDVLDKLGGGGCGSVYRARDPVSGELVAIKVLKPEVAADERVLQRFMQEFIAARGIASPHIVRALDYDHEGELPYLVMEFVDGQDLWQYATARGRLPEDEAVRIIAQVAQGLHQAHERDVIHRDVKPDNILLRLTAGPSSSTSAWSRTSTSA